MIRINNLELDKKSYPDSTCLIHLEPYENAEIEWIYEGDEEVFHVFLAARHLRERGSEKLKLVMPFLPNARMDRVKRRDEVFTLKYFCELINSMKFDEVEIWDAHSNVGVALLDRVVNVSPSRALQNVLDRVGGENLIIYFADEGALKRYADLFPSYPIVYGIKKRNWENGKIEGLELVKHGVELRGARVLMVDDICSYGGTFYYSATKLKEEGAAEIYSYSTHTEGSLLKDRSKYYKLLLNREVERHFTTESLVREHSDFIEVVEYRDK